ncbi:MAG TPA: copper resistance protein B [Alphaproteobacteria bacterium]|nr:copper resistance protein B [Alphaproteobacteria bacterium]USO05454.1 MAG: copper resistance protein B [Rhodospirillales bacterium]HOO81738.1 copper resistance protein B [Alphaproteobacteria bacterium]
MRTKLFFTTSLFLLAMAMPAFAEEAHNHNPADHQHGSEAYHMFRVETDYGAGEHGPVARFDIDGWYGTDENKLWLRSEVENSDGVTEKAEFQALYSRNVATFWDLQAGLRHDTQPTSTTYAVFGVEGLAPYFFETEAHLFVSDEGDVTARLREENDFLVTQRLILQPYAEVNLSAQDVEDQEIGAGLTDGEIGLQTRYEFTRKFAPYIDVRYERKFGETSSIAKSNGEDNDNFIAGVGLRLMF